MLRRLLILAAVIAGVLVQVFAIRDMAAGNMDGTPPSLVDVLLNGE